jgi:hypothetical protein
MPTRTFYRTTEVTTTGSDISRVKVHTGGLFVSSSLVNTAAEVVLESKKRVTAAIMRLQALVSGTSDLGVELGVNQCFKTGSPPSPDQVLKIVAKIELLNTGLTGSVELKANVNGARAMEKTGVTVSDPTKIAGYAGIGPDSPMKIHVKREILEGKRLDACRWFLHEASHKFASTVDHIYLGSHSRSSAEWRTLDFDKLVNNADSYGVLICQASS